MSAYRTGAEMPPKVPATPPFSSQSPKCPKCAHVGITHNVWQPNEQVLLRSCLDCKYQWRELPADASP